MNDVVGEFLKEGQAKKAEAAGEISADESRYRLFGNKPRRRIRLIRESGDYYSIHYDDIHTIEGTASGTLLTVIIKGGLLWELRGKHLATLANYLDEYRVIKLYVYDPARHTLEDENAPIITKITEKHG
jgi:hypothetical protein